MANKTVKRKPYVAPKLREFGPVGALTQAGSGTASEVVCSRKGMESKSRQGRC